MSRFVLTALLGGGILASVLSATPTYAQVTYAPPSASPFGLFFSPYDDSYDTHPSYQIGTTASGETAVRVVHRCAYIGGWNVGDFDRNLNGTPLGVGHTCPEDEPHARIRAAY